MIFLLFSQCDFLGFIHLILTICYKTKKCKGMRQVIILNNQCRESTDLEYFQVSTDRYQILKNKLEKWLNISQINRYNSFDTLLIPSSTNRGVRLLLPIFYKFIGHCTIYYKAGLLYSFLPLLYAHEKNSYRTHLVTEEKNYLLVDEL